MHKFVLIAAGFVAALSAPAQAATVMDFNDLGSYTSGAYHEDGYVLSGNICNSQTSACIKGVSSALDMDPTGNAVVKATGAATTFTVAREDGGAFQFGSMDFGKLNTTKNTYSSTYQFKFTLADADATEVTRYFTFLLNNPSPVTVHTATFADLGDITKFTFRNQSAEAQFDNITLLSSAVPEPATWAMMISGFGLIGGTLRRRAPKALLA